MIPKDKAIEIYENIYRRLPLCLNDTFRHASARTISMYMVNEIIETFDVSIDKVLIDEWKEVKQEIRNI